MFRVLRSDGIVYLAVPDKRFPSTSSATTPLEHIVHDYEEGWSACRPTSRSGRVSSTSAKAISNASASCRNRLRITSCSTPGRCSNCSLRFGIGSPHDLDRRRNEHENIFILRKSPRRLPATRSRTLQEILVTGALRGRQPPSALAQLQADREVTAFDNPKRRGRPISRGFARRGSRSCGDVRVASDLLDLGPGSHLAGVIVRRGAWSRTC